MKKHNQKVIVGISGGVDSAVSAYLLIQQGYDVEGIFMQNWDSFVNNENYDNKKEKCDAQYEYEDALRICNHLGITLHKVNFVKEYWNDVFQKFLSDYKKGYTPNPDVLCNSYIKFGHLLQYVIKNFNCDYIATGHYAGIEHNKSGDWLTMATDENKDQTYFLCDLKPEQLKYCLFPLKNYKKDEVRKIAKDVGLPIWNKKDSTGICFIGERNFKEFLNNYIPNKQGDIIDIETKEVIAKHDGVMFYTIGQNNNLKLSGMKYKYFVCDKDINKNILYVVREENKQKYLSSKSCIINNFNWIRKPCGDKQIFVRFRHRQQLIMCLKVEQHNDGIIIYYPSDTLSVTPGQYAVLYQDGYCLGGGQIDLVNK